MQRLAGDLHRCRAMLGEIRLSTCVTPTLLLIAPTRERLLSHLGRHERGMLELPGRYALQAGAPVELHLASADHPTMLRVVAEVVSTRLAGSPRCPPCLRVAAPEPQWERCRALLAGPANALVARRRRFGVRLALSVEVPGHGVLQGHTADVSRSGLMVHTPQRLPIGTGVTLSCSRCFGRVRARVARSTPAGLAFTIEPGAEAWVVFVERVAQFALMAAHPMEDALEPWALARAG